MKGTRTRMAAVAALLALAASACGKAALQEPVPAEEPRVEEPAAVEDVIPSPFTTNDVERIVLKESEAPKGTRLANRFSAEVALAHVFSGSAGKELAGSPAKDRFVGGLENEFVSEGGLSAGAIDSGALLFGEAATADEAFQLLVADYSSRQRVEQGLQAVKEISTNGLGKESFGIRGSFDPRFPGFDFVAYTWRRANLLLYVYGWGPGGERADTDDILQVARTMDSRATAASQAELQTFISGSYGYSIGYPAGWSVRESTEALSEGGFPADFNSAVERFYQDSNSLEPEILVAAQKLAEGTTLEEWTANTARLIATAIGYEKPVSSERMRVGGEAATLLTYPDTGHGYHLWTTVVHGSEGFHVIWLNRAGTEAADRALFERVLQTFAFTE